MTSERSSTTTQNLSIAMDNYTTKEDVLRLAISDPELEAVCDPQIDF
jgi:hypothetical protein